MINTIKNDKKDLVIVSLINGENKIKIFQDLENIWKKYFFVNHIIDQPENLKKYLNKKVDILFFESDSFEKFDLEFYGKFKSSNQFFAFISVANKRSKDDVHMYKMLADQIIFLDEKKSYLEWNSISILRRYWSTYSKPTTIIYKNIIADFVERKFVVNKKLVDLTVKESELLRFLLINKNEYIPKQKLFKVIWGYDEEDTSRALDQMIFKLKKKMGDDLFHIKRNAGIKFS